MKKLTDFTPKPSCEIKDSRVSIGFECLDRRLFNPDKCYDLLGASGIKYARVQTGWAVCERERGVIDFTWLDGIVDNLISRGVIPWFNVGFGNPVYMPDLPNPTGVGCVPLYYGQECIEAWKRFTYALGEHYKGRVTHYEIWNEPDITHFWYPEKPDGKKLAELVSMTGAQIRRSIPDAKIGVCTSGTESRYVIDFASNLKPGELDFNCFHHYLKNIELNFGERAKTVIEIFKKHGHELSYWMGEGGYPSWAYEGHWMCFKKGNLCSERQQAVAQLRYYFNDIALGFERVSFFQMADMWERPYEKAREVLAKPAAQGILNGLTYTPKHSYYTLSRLATLFRDDAHVVESSIIRTLAGSDPITELAIRAHAYKRGDNVFFAYWLPTDIEDECPDREGFTLEARVFRDCEPIECPVLVNMYTGEVFELEGAKLLEGGIKVSGLPIGEAPMVVCDLSLVK